MGTLCLIFQLYGVVLLTGSTTRCTRGGFRSVYQLVPWLRAPAADGPQIALSFHTEHYVRLQRYLKGFNLIL